MKLKKEKLGRTDLRISELCLSTSNFSRYASQEASFAMLASFREAGGNFIQISGICPGVNLGDGFLGMPEELLGRWLKLRRIERASVLDDGVRQPPSPGCHRLRSTSVYRQCEYRFWRSDRARRSEARERTRAACGTPSPARDRGMSDLHRAWRVDAGRRPTYPIVGAAGEIVAIEGIIDRARCSHTTPALSAQDEARLTAWNSATFNPAAPDTSWYPRRPQHA